MNPNKKHKLLYQTQRWSKKNKKESIDDIKIHYIQRVIVEVSNNKGGKSNVVSFNGRQVNGKIVKGITRKWLIPISIYVRTSSTNPLFIGTVSSISKFHLEKLILVLLMIPT